MKYHVVAAISELEDSSQMHVNIDGEDILLVKDHETIYAVSYFCSHAEFTLEGGFITNGCITCPYHGAEFDLSDGSVLAPPAFEPLKTYPVRIEEDTIAIGMIETD